MIGWCSYFMVILYLMKMLVLEGIYCEISYYLNLINLVFTVLFSFFVTVKNFVRTPARILSVCGHCESSLFLTFSCPFAEVPFPFFPNIYVLFNCFDLSFIVSPLVVSKIEISGYYAKIDFFIKLFDELELTYSLD